MADLVSDYNSFFFEYFIMQVEDKYPKIQTSFSVFTKLLFHKRFLESYTCGETLSS